LNSTGEGAFYSQTPESCLEDLGVNIKYPRPLWERVPKAGEGSINKEILRPSAEVLSATSTTNAQNDRIIPLSEGRGRNCANGSERTISGEGLVKESKNQVDMLDFAILRRCTPQNDNLKSPLPPFNKGGKTASLLREVSRSAGGFENTLCHSERSEELQSRMQRIVCALTPTLSRRTLKPAFTLAEVLITLGIVGIIAAMTLPMLAEKLDIKKAPWLELFNILIYCNLSSADCSCNVNTWCWSLD